MSTDPQDGATPASRPSQSPASQGSGQGPAQGRHGRHHSPTRSSRSPGSMGLPSWPKLKAHVESLEEVGQLKQAIDTQRSRARQDADDAQPGAAPRAARLWQGRAADVGRRMPRAVGAARVRRRLAMARWMIENGSDVHQGGDGPLMRAALNGDRIPMMELLVSLRRGRERRVARRFPDHLRALRMRSIRWRSNGCWITARIRTATTATASAQDTALDYVIGTYARSPERCAPASICCSTPAARPSTTRRACWTCSAAARSPGRATRRRSRSWCTGDFPNSTAAARAAAACCSRRDAAARGRGVRQSRRRHGCCSIAAPTSTRRATVDDAGVGGQTAIFHAVTQFDDGGLPMAQLLMERGADLSRSCEDSRATTSGRMKSSNARRWGTPDGFRHESHSEGKTIAFLKERGAIE